MYTNRIVLKVITRIVFTLILHAVDDHNASVIKQKGESENGCYKEIDYAKFSVKRTFHTP